MEALPIKGALKHEVLKGLEASPLFAALDGRQLDQISGRAELLQYEVGETLTVLGEPSEHFYLVMSGEAAVLGPGEVELARIGPYECVGEMGVLLDAPRSATVRVTARLLALSLRKEVFEKLMNRVPEFGLALARALARRLADARQRPLEHDAGAADPETKEIARPNASPRLDLLLRRMIDEGASDLHLSPGRRPRWRIDGEIFEIEDAPPLGEQDVLALLEPVMVKRSKAEFGADHDADFAYALEGVSRFRVNLFREAHGVGAVLRRVPMKIMSFEELGLPEVVRKLCELPKGLVLVTGPTGSGKSTTLAAMIDHINRSRRAHIVTLEDPIEFMHASHKALVNQREVGAHTKSFARALRAALREDPDIVLVGEMRDLETIAMALETAQTGHLVFATLHTSTAMSTVDRIIDMFPADQQAQIRTSLSETLRGIIAQTLCKRIGGGRVAALEILVATPAVSNLVREGKTYQLVSIMQTGRGLGMSMLNERLAELVFKETITAEEALARAVDKPELTKRLGVDYPLL